MKLRVGGEKKREEQVYWKIINTVEGDRFFTQLHTVVENDNANRKEHYETMEIFHREMPIFEAFS